MLNKTKQANILYLQPEASVLQIVILLSLSRPITYFEAFGKVLFRRIITSVIATQWARFIFSPVCFSFYSQCKSRLHSLGTCLFEFRLCS